VLRHLRTTNNNFIQTNTVKLDYNEQIGTGVRYNRANLCSKGSFWTEIFVRYNQVFVIAEFVINEFHCTSIRLNQSNAWRKNAKFVL